MYRLAIIITAVPLLLAARGDRPDAGARVPALPSPVAPGDDCLEVRGPVQAAFAESSVTHPVDGDPAGIEGETGGDVVSRAYAWVDFLSHDPGDPSWDGEIQIRMRHLYVDPDGAWTVWTVDEGVLAPVGDGVYQFHNRLEVAGGSGAFDGVTGALQSHGTVDFATNEIVLEYQGRLCPPE